MAFRSVLQRFFPKQKMVVKPLESQFGGVYFYPSFPSRMPSVNSQTKLVFVPVCPMERLKSLCPIITNNTYLRIEEMPLNKFRFILIKTWLATRMSAWSEDLTRMSIWQHFVANSEKKNLFCAAGWRTTWRLDIHHTGYL